jgi:hypothetical protein
VTFAKPRAAVNALDRAQPRPRRQHDSPAILAALAADKVAPRCSARRVSQRVSLAHCSCRDPAADRAHRRRAAAATRSCRGSCRSASNCWPDTGLAGPTRGAYDVSFALIFSAGLSLAAAPSGRNSSSIPERPADRRMQELEEVATAAASPSHRARRFARRLAGVKRHQMLVVVDDDAQRKLRHRMTPENRRLAGRYGKTLWRSDVVASSANLDCGPHLWMSFAGSGAVMISPTWRPMSW